MSNHTAAVMFGAMFVSGLLSAWFTRSETQPPLAVRFVMMVTGTITFSLFLWHFIAALKDKP